MSGQTSLSIGRIFSRFGDLTTQLASSLLLLALLLAGNMFVFHHFFPFVPGKPLPLSLPALLASALISMFLQLTTIALALDQANSRGASLPAAFGTAARRYFPILLTGLIVGIAVSAASLLLIIPGILLMLRWCVASTAQLDEGCSSLQAMARSRALTTGHRWKILGYLFVFFLLIAGAGVLLILALGLVMAVTGVHHTAPAVAPAAGGLLAVQLLSNVFSAALMTIGATAHTALYLELRALKDGASTSFAWGNAD